MTSFSLENIIPDIPKAQYLERMLKNTTSSYKFFWLKGVIDCTCADMQQVDFNTIVARMVSSAWYPVLYFHLSFGVSDRLANVVNYLHETHHIPQTAREDEVEKAVPALRLEDGRLRGMMDKLHAYVPQRLIRPFYEYEVVQIQNELRAQGDRRPDSRTDDIILQQNWLSPNRAMYAIGHDRASLTVSDEWMRFIQQNRAIIYGWLDARLTDYLQARNPSVPAISLKLRPPHHRDLQSATRYWNYAIENADLSDIYLHQEFNVETFDTNGPMSVDHFIPWSFVLHDEMWNLTPTFRNVNSSKNDRLPDLQTYLEPFCNLQFKALRAVYENCDTGRFQKQLMSYRMIDPEINEYDSGDRSRDRFIEALHKTIVPLYQIALNQGYGIWAA